MHVVIVRLESTVWDTTVCYMSDAAYSGHGAKQQYNAAPSHMLLLVLSGKLLTKAVLLVGSVQRVPCHQSLTRATNTS